MFQKEEYAYGNLWNEMVYQGFGVSFVIKQYFKNIHKFNTIG